MSQQPLPDATHEICYPGTDASLAQMAETIEHELEKTALYWKIKRELKVTKLACFCRGVSSGTMWV